MRIAVLVIRRRREQAAAFVQRFADGAIRCVKFGVDDAALTAQPSPIRTIFAIGFDRKDRINAVRLAQVEIILTMVRGHVDEASAAFGGNEIAREHWAGFGKKGNAVFKRFIA